ncbi:F-box domain-containing protein [Artemisia annua]|uniref:F-box domain-containing protein n=1 Tax=Artemisia annua TaxID=35608 RepID=A0A2U1P331_ARTAN|nr:F-box domain-containing protein [Artemisia annua]
MVDVHIPDCILHNILDRLPTKDLARFKCVSKHWSRLIIDPYFLKFGSRRMILLIAAGSPLHVVDPDDTSNLMFKLRFPFGNPKSKDVKCLGIFNGIAILVFKAYCVDNKSTYIRTILYNPFTAAYELVPDPHSECLNINHIYGFGYGATPDDLKIIRFSDRKPRRTESCRTFDVFSFKSNSWNRSTNKIRNVKYTSDVGTFLNGYLHWIVYKRSELMIMALNVDSMALSDIPLPHYNYKKGRLGTLDGCLCIADIHGTQLVVSVMKEQGVWSNRYLGASLFNKFFVVSILDGGGILMMDFSNKFIIYNTLESSNEVMKKFSGYIKCVRGLTGVEYMVSGASPSDLFAL